MDLFGKSSKVQGKNDMESLGIRSGPILFDPDRNEYELRIELPGCPKDKIKVTYDKPSGKLKLEGQKLGTEFVQQFTVPSDCLATGIYGRFRGDVLHLIMPRLLSDWPASGNASSKQEDDQKASSDRKSTEEAGEKVGKDHDKLPARAPAPPPSDQKSTDEVGQRGGKDRDKLPARVPAPPPSDQKSTDEVGQRGGKDRDKLPARVSPPSDQKTTEKSRQRDDELFPEISAPPPSDRESSRSVKELREKFQKNLSKFAASPPPLGPPAPSNRKTSEIRARKEKEDEDQEPPSTVVPASPSPDQKKKDTKAERSVVESQKKEKKSNQEIAKNAKIFTGSKDKDEREEKKPSAGGNEKLGLVAKVKETGKAAVAVAMKEENRRVVIIGAAVLAIVVIGAASLRSSSKKTKN